LNKKFVLLVVTSFFAVGCLPVGSTQEIPRPYHMIVAYVGSPRSVDPAWAYDTASSELIFNVYETLIFYNRESVDEFVPMLATDWLISEDGLTYTFKIREGVKFHNGETLTTEDVEYSFERVMVQDRSGGPAWMLYEVLLGCQKANLNDPDWGVKIEDTVQSNDTHVWFNLASSYAPFPAILSQSWSSIVNKKFCVEHGDWPGTWEKWQDYHDPDVSPLDDPEPAMCGTGPYILDSWIYGEEWSIVKFDEYWRGWPAHGCRGYVERATVKLIASWLARKTMFLDGEVDIAYVPKMYMHEIFGQPGIECIYPLPELSCYGIFFNQNISLRSWYLKPPHSVELDYGELNEGGIPPDFFSDIDVRKGFAYAINYTEFLQTAYFSWAIYPGTPVIEGLPFRDPDQERYEFNLTRTEEHLRKAWNGQLWTTGFTLTIPYQMGSLPRETIAKMLEANIESLNPKFHINAQAVEWGMPVSYRLLTLFMSGWLADYPDPHNFVYAFMHSTGTFSVLQDYGNATVDTLVEEGLKMMNTSRRREIYYELQQIYHDECPSVAIYQPIGRHWERTWVQGWYYNPAYPGLYFYHLWKEDLPPEDLNLDGTVNILDVGVAAEAFASFCHLPDVHPRWKSRADFNHDQNVDIRDIAAVARKFGSQAVPWQLP